MRGIWQWRQRVFQVEIARAGLGIGNQGPGSNLCRPRQCSLQGIEQDEFTKTSKLKKMGDGHTAEEGDRDRESRQ